MKRMATVFFLALLSAPVFAANAPFAEVDKAGIFLRDFEKEVERAQGADSGRYFNKQEALSRIKRLSEQYPDDPKVQELVKRASTALMKSKGDYMEITPGMLAYKKNEAELRERFKAQNQAAWEDQLRQKNPITKVFPTPVPEEVDVRDYLEKYVLLEDVRYPANQFAGATGEYIHVGKPSIGYYFVSMQGRHWSGPYEAIRRYRSMVDASLGDNLKFKILGKITGLVMESPDASEDKKAPVVWGWIVTPEMLYAGDRVLAMYDSKNENSGYFFGEDQVEKIKESWYTVKSIPDNVDPKRLMEIFATAIKEKNYKLYLECINPERGNTDVGSSMLRYHWDLHQARFQNEYVHAVFDEPKITVLKGFDDKNDLEGYFLNPGQREQLNKMAGEREEMAVVMSRAFEENGKQRGSKNRHELLRKGKGRWYVNTYDVRF
ncbi:MAG: hypothetical protein IKS68_04455 [Mailhella sp.]|nr:hypothetical protein [Mailhella sp.]